MASQFQVVRGPVERKSGTLDYADQYLTKLRTLRNQMRSQAETELKQNLEWARVQHYIRALTGQQWDDARPRYRSHFVDNLLSKTRKDAMSAYTDIRPAVEIKTSNEHFKDVAKIVDLGVRDQWDRHEFDMRMIKVIDHALMGVGYWKIAAARNRLAVIPCGMDMVMPINNPGDLQESSAVYYRTNKPLLYFRRAGFRKEQVLKIEKRSSMNALDSNDAYGVSRPGHIAEYTWATMNPALRRKVGVTGAGGRTDGYPTVAFPMYPVDEIWIEDDAINETGKKVTMANPLLPLDQHNYWYEVEPGERLYPRKRLLVWSGDELLYDGIGPYTHPLYPFEDLILDPVVFAPGGFSKYRNLLPFNRAINKIAAAVLDVVDKATNPTYAVSKNAMSSVDWNRFYPDKAGQKLMFNQGVNPSTAIQSLQPPALPPYVLRMLEHLMQQYERHSGAIDMTAITKKNQLPGGDAIETMRDMQSAHYRLEGKYIGSFLKKTGTQLISNFLQYFTTQGRAIMLGNDGIALADFDSKPGNLIPGTFDKGDRFYESLYLSVHEGTLHSAGRDRERQIAIALAKMGKLSLKTLYEVLDVPWNADEELQRVSEEVQATGMMGAGGRTPRLNREQRNGGV